MKENDNNNTSVKLTEVGQTESPEAVETSQDRLKKLRKPIIFGLMSIVFVACMYMIFVPDKKAMDEVGLNEVVPQASDAGMQEDKGKAYESDLMEQKELERKKSLATLSDYWNGDSTASETNVSKPGSNPAAPLPDYHNQALSSYRNIQGTLGNFYEDKGETAQLQNEVRSLKSQLAQKENVGQTNPVESQLALMEKSYQMAAKYFPTGGNVKSEVKETTRPKDTFEKTGQKLSFAALYPATNIIVSALNREPSDSAWLAELSRGKNRNFFGIGKTRESFQTVNSIRACIHQEQLVVGNSAVGIRLLENATIDGQIIPKGTVLTGTAKFQGSRLQLLISSIEFGGNIIPVEISAYDLQGQPGLPVSVSAERSAITETIANMGNTSGTSVSLSSTAGQQITSDLSKSVVQGISGYFSKKVRTPKVTLKTGYKVFLIAKK
ncbi:conjugative transposon protein TraM [Pedobacter sp. ISL-68]|uniref:conjugative transposon protein TraM n=1 Tax=unclassified Pedobacter TaxID=2628915 RepID=UPI001BEBB1F3|nr:MULTISPECIES: conjugative transposon protein TraM [unclassified Pedobacter]MBT2559820.1 conjugative transposon protein TraM [Pedobacter sp. ISL-64]MBT2592125.1 conjugative transposon protein TraM [Pedobacter sp. ISL-68]